MKKSIMHSAVIIMVMTLISRLIGFVRDMLMAHEFGVSFTADAYNLAFTIPNTLFLFIPGALNAIFVPSLRGLLTLDKKKEAKQLFSKMLSLVTILYFLIAILGIVFSKEIVQLLAPSYDASQVKMTADLMQIMWPSAVFISLIGLFQATLNSHQEFFVPMLSSTVNSIVIISAYPILVPFYGIYGVAIGTTFGFAFAAITMIPSIIKHQYSFRPDFYWKTTEMKSIGERFIPIMFGSFVTQMTVFIERYLASGLGDGKISALRYGFTLYQLPMSMFVAAFTLPIFPYLVEYFRKGQFKEMKESITDGLQYLFILMIPTIVAIIILAPDFVSLVYHWGEGSKFGDDGVYLTSQALIFYSLGLFFLAGRDLLTRAFYAAENTLIPVIVAVISIAIFVISSILLIPYLDHAGIALGTTVGSTANMLILAFLLKRKIGSFIETKFWHTVWKTSLASAVMGIILFIVSHNVDSLTLIQEKIITVTLILSGSIIYGIIMILLKESKVVVILNKFKRKG